MNYTGSLRETTELRLVAKVLGLVPIKYPTIKAGIATTSIFYCPVVKLVRPRNLSPVFRRFESCRDSYKTDSDEVKLVFLFQTQT